MAKAGKFYGTRAWRDCRAAYMTSVSGLCEVCLNAGIITPAEIVHHKIHLTDAELQDPNIALNYDNLQALCRRHHAEAHPEMYRKNILNVTRLTMPDALLLIRTHFINCRGTP